MNFRSSDRAAKREKSYRKRGEKKKLQKGPVLKTGSDPWKSLPFCPDKFYGPSPTNLDTERREKRKEQIKEKKNREKERKKKDKKKGLEGTDLAHDCQNSRNRPGFALRVQTLRIVEDLAPGIYHSKTRHNFSPPKKSSLWLKLEFEKLQVQSLQVEKSLLHPSPSPKVGHFLPSKMSKSRVCENAPPSSLLLLLPKKLVAHGPSKMSRPPAPDPLPALDHPNCRFFSFPNPLVFFFFKISRFCVDLCWWSRPF